MGKTEILRHFCAVSCANFARSGFAPALVARAAAEGVRLVGPELLVV